MIIKKKDFALGILCGAMLFSGATAMAAGNTAEPIWQSIYVDGKQVSMTAYNIAGNDYPIITFRRSFINQISKMNE